MYLAPTTSLRKPNHVYLFHSMSDVFRFCFVFIWYMTPPIPTRLMNVDVIFNKCAPSWTAASPLMYKFTKFS